MSIVRKKPTYLGFFALFVWSFSALFASTLSNLPVFETLAIIFSISCITILAKVIRYKEWYKLKQPFSVYLIGILGIYGNDVFYFEAFKHAPAAHIDLINYLWPIFVVIFSSIVAKEKSSYFQYIGSILSFIGIYILIANEHHFVYKPEYLRGYLYGLADALIWALYVMVARRNRHIVYSEAIGVYCGICFLISLVVHMQKEVFVLPTSSQVGVMIIIGICSQGLSYLFWEQSIKKGNYKLLTNCAYLTPVSSILILVLFNKAPFTYNIIVATACVTLGAIIANKTKQPSTTKEFNTLEHRRPESSYVLEK